MDALKQLKLAKNGYIIMSVLFMVLGACLIIWPDCSMAVFCTAVGIMLIVYGLIKILGYFSRDIYCLAFQFDLAFGVLMAAVGIIIIVRRNVVVNLIFGIFGLLILADALFKNSDVDRCKEIRAESLVEDSPGSDSDRCSGIFTFDKAV